MLWLRRLWLLSRLWLAGEELLLIHSQHILGEMMDALLSYHVWTTIHRQCGGQNSETTNAIPKKIEKDEFWACEGGTSAEADLGVLCRKGKIRRGKGEGREGRERQRGGGGRREGEKGRVLGADEAEEGVENEADSNLARFLR